MFEFRNRFSIQAQTAAGASHWIFRDTLSPRSARLVEDAALHLDTREARLAALRMFMSPCIGQAPLPVCGRPETPADSHFWQFPAVTEGLAFGRHAELPPPVWHADSPVQAYLGLPWASYIDKADVPAVVKQVFGVRLRGYRALAEAWGLQWGVDVKVHTVCQHIYWDRLLSLWQELGVTDLHLSHCEPKSAAVAEQHGIRVHAWPLAAANVVNPERREGLVFGKSLQERRLLASFVGAHMPHYRSDVRLRLREEVARDGGADVVFELRDDWHFNPIVYGVQVRGKAPTAAEAMAERDATIRYNRLLAVAVFSLCPEGAGPNTLRLWESLAVGAIPVVIVEDWVWPTVPGTGLDWDEAVIKVARSEVDGLLSRLRRLRADAPARLDAMRAAGMALYARFERALCF